jgi:hypothetical protein
MLLSLSQCRSSRSIFSSAILSRGVSLPARSSQDQVCDLPGVGNEGNVPFKFNRGRVHARRKEVFQLRRDTLQ